MFACGSLVAVHYLQISLRIEQHTVQILPERRLRSTVPPVTPSRQDTGANVETAALKMKTTMRLACTAESYLTAVFLAHLAGRISCMKLEMRHAQKEGLRITGKKEVDFRPNRSKSCQSCKKRKLAENPLTRSLLFLQGRWLTT